jgi:hypothetical protein
VLVRDRKARDRWCLRVGITATVMFALIAVITATGTFEGGVVQATMTGLAQQKYPPSQPFLLMTLGPLLALMPLADRAMGPIGRLFDSFGRVPMFYYLCHIPLIHLLALGVGWLRDGALHPEWYTTAPYASVPPEHRWPLWLLYVVFVIAIAVLYPLCRWYVGIKTRRRNEWLSYL